MYQVDPSKFTSKPDPKIEFIQYFKNSGAAAALQKAMILLYRMPVKPDNLYQYFSEFFENGAQRLMRISLLKAEVCYKKDELAKHEERVAASEERINELLNLMGISEEEFNDRFIPEKIKENNRLSILERYFKDLERGTLKSMDVSLIENSVEETAKSRTDSATDFDWKDYDPVQDCLKNVHSDIALRDDINELDPWGIICRVPALQKIRGFKGDDRAKEMMKQSSDFVGRTKSEISLLMDEASKYPGPDIDMDEDDGATLAEIFHQSAFDWMSTDQDEQKAKLHNQLFSVRNAEPTTLASFMGWSPLQSREDFRAPYDQSSHFSHTQAANYGTHLTQSLGVHRGQGPNFTQSPSTHYGQGDFEPLSALQFIEKPLDEAESELFDNDNTFNENYRDIEALRRKPCQQRMQEALAAEELERSQTPQEDTDAFLFDDEEEDYENAYRMMEMEAAQQGFDFEFQEYSRASRGERKEGVCQPVCDIPGADLICASRGVESSTGESVPGTMSNWTHKLQEYPSSLSEGFPDDEEGRIPPPSRSRQGTSRKDLPVTRVDSSCHCLLAGTYSANDMYDDDEEDQNDGKLPASQSTDSKTRVPGMKDEATITEDAVLESELDEVFKKNKSRRSSAYKSAKYKKDKDEIDDEVEDAAKADAFGVVSLAKEIRRTVLGLTETELKEAQQQDEQKNIPVPVMTKHKRMSPADNTIFRGKDK